MAQELTTFADRPALSPKYSKFFEEHKNIQDRATVPSVSYEGKKWTLVLGGEKRVVQKRDADGDLVPVTTLKVVVLDQNPVLVLAWWDGRSRGTAHTIGEAKKRGIPVEITTLRP